MTARRLLREPGRCRAHPFRAPFRGEGLVLSGRLEGADYHLYDVIGPRLPDWAALRACLPLVAEA